MTKGAEGSSGIPADVMAAAKASFHAFSPIPDAFDAFNTALIVEGIARAIMAERERAAAVCRDYGAMLQPWDESDYPMLQAYRHCAELIMAGSA